MIPFTVLFLFSVQGIFSEHYKFDDPVPVTPFHNHTEKYPYDLLLWQPVHIITIDTETTTFCDDLNTHIRNAQNGITHLETLIDELSDLQQSKHKYVEQQCITMIKQINELKDSVIKPKIDAICLNKINKLQSQINLFKVYLKKLNDAQQNVSAALRDTSLNNQTRKAKIEAPVKASVNYKMSFHPNVSPFIDVKCNASGFARQIKQYWDISAYGKPYHQRIEFEIMRSW